MICPVCKEDKDASKFHYVDGRLRSNACFKCRGKRERSKLKLDFLMAFNFTCSCCGETDSRFLTLDHVNNDGNIHREKFNEQQIFRQARKEGYPKDRYQCLCFNCNCGKSANNGICPHKCVTKEQYVEKLEENVFSLGRSLVRCNTSNLEEARENLKKKRDLLKALKGFSQEQIDAIVASITG